MAVPLLKVDNLTKHFSGKKSLFAGKSANDNVIPAVDGISFYINENETLGLVGESGCGKTTTGKAVLKLTSITNGNIAFQGNDITAMKEKDFRPYRSNMQMVFQDLDAALNPQMRIRDILAETIRVHGKADTPEGVQAEMERLLDLVNLQKHKLDSYPTELSGGEKRRIGLMRVLTLEPKLIIADEPTSALDVSIQAQVVNLFMDLQEKLGLSYLFISHDLPLVELLSHRIAVMYLGQIVEMGPAAEIVHAPQHPYTQILWSAESGAATKEVDNMPTEEDGENWGVYDFQRPQTGCRFAPRCPTYAAKGKPAACTDPDNPPGLHGGEHVVACHFPLGS